MFMNFKQKNNNNKAVLIFFRLCIILEGLIKINHSIKTKLKSSISLQHGEGERED